MEREAKKTFTFSATQTLRDKIEQRATKEGLNFSEKVNQLFDRELKPNLDHSVKVLTRTLKKDKDLWRSYQANISMAFIDECNRVGYPISEEDVSEISNRAAENFMKLWTK